MGTSTMPRTKDMPKKKAIKGTPRGLGLLPSVKEQYDAAMGRPGKRVSNTPKGRLEG